MDLLSCVPAPTVLSFACMSSEFSARNVLVFAAAALFAAAFTTACGGSPTQPDTAPPAQDPATAASLGVTADVQPILHTDCLECHGPSRQEQGYNFSSYAGVMRAVTAGSANSPLVRVTQPGGAMYKEFRGSSTAKAETIRRWVVDFRAAQ